MLNLEPALNDAIETLRDIREHYEAEYLKTVRDVSSSVPHPATAIRNTNAYLEFLYGTINGMREDAERESRRSSAD